MAALLLFVLWFSFSFVLFFVCFHCLAFHWPVRSSNRNRPTVDLNGTLRYSNRVTGFYWVLLRSMEVLTFFFVLIFNELFVCLFFLPSLPTHGTRTNNNNNNNNNNTNNQNEQLSWRESQVRGRRRRRRRDGGGGGGRFAINQSIKDAAHLHTNRRPAVIERGR